MITNDINRCFIIGWWRTMSRDIVLRNHHARLLQTSRMFSRDSKGAMMVAQWTGRAIEERRTCDSNEGKGGKRTVWMEVTVFVNSLRKIRDEWRSDTMQARCRREQNRRHPPSSFVAATRVSPEIRPTGTIHHRFAKEERTRRNIKKGGKPGRGGGKEGAGSKASGDAWRR